MLSLNVESIRIYGFYDDDGDGVAAAFPGILGGMAPNSVRRCILTTLQPELIRY